MDREELKLYITRIHKLDGEGVTKAFVDISIMDAIIINGLRIVEGADGLFVSMPRESGKDGKWYNTVIPLRKEVKELIDRVVLEAYIGTVNARSEEKMTYRKLLTALNQFSEEQLDLDVSVFMPSSDEFFSGMSIGPLDTDVLDKGHPVIVAGGIK